ncbi:Scarecrow-like protein 8 [Linum grandiflorum]
MASRLPGRASSAVSGLFSGVPRIGKRKHADFQPNQIPNHGSSAAAPTNPGILRYVKPRLQQSSSPNSTLFPVDYSSDLRSRHPSINTVSRLAETPKSVKKKAKVTSRKSDEKTTMTRDHIRELEKHLFNDDEVAVSEVMTNAESEWFETMQNLITPISSQWQNQEWANPDHCTESVGIVDHPGSVIVSSPSLPTVMCTRQVLMEAAAEINEGRIAAAAEILSRVKQPPEERSRWSSEQRLMDYLFKALKSRVNPAENPPRVAELNRRKHFESTQLLFKYSPCFKLGFMAANMEILESALDDGGYNWNNIHIVDFNLGLGGQYTNLLNAFRQRVKSEQAILKITAVPDGDGNVERSRLKAVGQRLGQVAEQVGIILRFSIVSCRLDKLDRESLGCELGEILAVNLPFKLYRMADESVSTDNPRDELLRRVKSLQPYVVTVAEQEMNVNTSPFMTRVNETCEYYSALFESIGSTVQNELERQLVEEGLGRKLVNTIACEGTDRVERSEVYGKWRARMVMAGFRMKPVTENQIKAMQETFNATCGSNSKFIVKEDNGRTCFGWMDKILTVASAWH